MHLADVHELLAVDFEDPALARKTSLEPRQLRDADRGLEIRELEVETDGPMEVVAAGSPHRPPLVLELAKTRVDPFVVSKDRSALAGRDGLVRREGEASRDTECPEGPAAPARDEGLGRILNDRDVVARGDGEDVLDLGAASAHVDGYDRLRPLGDRPLELRRIEAQAALLDVGENHRRPGERRGVRGRDEREVGNDDLVARADSGGDQREVDRDGPTGYRHREARAGPLGDKTLEARRHLSVVQEIAVEDLFD